MYKRAVEAVAMLEVPVARTVDVARVAEHGVADRGEVAAHLGGAPLRRADPHERVAAEKLFARVARQGLALDTVVAQRLFDDTLVVRSTAREGEVVLLTCGERRGPGGRR